MPDVRKVAGAQLPLEFPHQIALGREDFFIAPSNEHAYAMIDAWPDWPKRTLTLVGPPGSGKTHLSTIWTGATSAAHAIAGDITVENVPALVGHGAVVLEDMPGEGFDETALFHFLNMIVEQGGYLLMTSGMSPAQWPVDLPDLRSRLRALPVAELQQPDEALLRAVLVKLFADRQLDIDETVVSFLLPRMERSISAARRLVDHIDRKALAQRSRITRPFVSKALEDFDATF